MCLLKTRHCAQASHLSLTKGVVGIVAQLAKVNDENLRRYMLHLIVFLVLVRLWLCVYICFLLACLFIQHYSLELGNVLGCSCILSSSAVITKIHCCLLNNGLINSSNKMIVNSDQLNDCAFLSSEGLVSF